MCLQLVCAIYPCGYSVCMIRNIIFDWSGTLVDDLPAVWGATNHVFRQAGLEEWTMERFRAEFSLPFRGFYERFTPQIPMQQLETWFHEHFRHAQISVQELPHAREFLESCKTRGIRTFLLSSIHRNQFKQQSSVTGFDRYLDRVYIEVHDKRAKIEELLRENSLDADETMFIGDMQHDIETAKHGEVRSCAVLTGYNSLEQLRCSEPDLIVEHLGELLQILERNEWDLSKNGEPSANLHCGHPISTVGALVYDDEGRVLMVRTHKWSNLWGIPGGKVKYGETLLDALRREIKEETNLEIKDIRLVLVQECIQSKEFYREAHFLLLNYICRCFGKPTVVLNGEGQEFRWLSTPEALLLALNQPTKKLLDAVGDYSEAFSNTGPWTQ